MMMKRISKVLIANRGEIARRVMRTCDRMGIATVAVFSDADADVPFVHEAGEAVRIGPAAASESYLVAEKIIAAAKRTGADAIHPGYGFLSENAAFAQAVEDAGLVFIGPTSDAIVQMGDKKGAKAIAESCGVPIIPGRSDLSDAEFADAAVAIGFPVLLKASAGGGGKGMKRVDRKEDVAAALVSAKREAKNSFGDDRMLLEKYIERPRHIEIQVLADTHGNVIHLLERECSIQRRHQKIIEESPSTAVSDALRQKMGETAKALARTIDYRGVGTVEFILDERGDYFFLEMNTRLQVEHPVTEEVLAHLKLDLVEEQIRVARGETLRLTQEDIVPRGHAIEARLYAENPANDFFPETGTLLDFAVPAREGLRVDAGVASGCEISVHYDPMIAKVIAFGDDREIAASRLSLALTGASVLGVVTNRAYLCAVLAHDAFRNGDTQTDFIPRYAPAADPPGREEVARAAILATCLGRAAREEARPLKVPSGFRNNTFAKQWVDYTHDGEHVSVAYQRDRFVVGDVEHHARLIRVDREGGALRVTFELDGHQTQHRVAHRSGVIHVSGKTSVTLYEQPRFPERVAEVPAGACVSPMPGKIVSVDAKPGDTVVQGQALLVMEAMKMEQTITAALNGTIEEVRVSIGDQVDADVVLIVITAEADAPSKI